MAMVSPLRRTDKMCRPLPRVPADRRFSASKFVEMARRCGQMNTSSQAEGTVKATAVAGGPIQMLFMIHHMDHGPYGVVQL